jgi:hypothetical protein
MKSKINYLILIGFTALFACKKVITLDLSTAPTAIAIEGNITNEQGPYLVTISKTVGFYQNNTFPTVSGAIVKITDSTVGITDSLIEKEAGVYVSSKIVGVIGHTYLLDVIAAGKEYKSSSTMPKQINLDSISFLTTAGFGKDVTNAVVNFQDPPGESNFYNFVERFRNIPPKQIHVFSDRLSDGRYISDQVFNDSTVNHRDTVSIEMQCVDKKVFSYLQELSGQDATNGQPTSPANPTSNISGGALGYFSAHTSQRKQAVFK